MRRSPATIAPRLLLASLWLVTGLTGWLPSGLAVAFCQAIGWLCYWLRPGLRAVVLANLTQVLPATSASERRCLGGRLVGNVAWSYYELAWAAGQADAVLTSRLQIIGGERLAAAGGVVVLAGDRPVAGPSRPVRLGAGWARLPIGPARLARLTGAVLLPVWSYRPAAGGWLIVIEPPVPLAEGTSPAAIELATTERLAAIWLAAVRRAPAQWAVLTPVWASAGDVPGGPPEGESPVV